MYIVTKYPHGTFSWADCASTDVDKARPFYTELMGWTFDEVPMGNDQMYSFLKKDGQTAAAISPMGPGMEQMPSHWNTYVTVDDLDSLPEKVTAAGGTVIAPPFDVFDTGRMMVVQDPTGAMINFWLPKTHIGASIVNAPGAMVWNEMATRDAAKAQAFFGDVLGWTFEPGEDASYHYIRNNGRMNGGMIEMNEMWGNMPSHWQVYFAVGDIDEVARRVPELGGKILSGVDESSVGRFAVIADPAGAMFAVIQMNQTTPWEE
ncbi:MAG: VOC family protein [bacterium]|nr:VOC family protein [bacterium]